MRELGFRVWNKALHHYRHFVLQKGVSVSIGADLEIEQYTGLKDKNGKEIYEGDIVRYGRHISGIIPPESRTAVVKWWSGEEEYYPCCTTSGFALPYSEDGYEVIGNIHENQELIGEEGK